MVFACGCMCLVVFNLCWISALTLLLVGQKGITCRLLSYKTVCRQLREMRANKRREARVAISCAVTGWYLIVLLRHSKMVNIAEKMHVFQRKVHVSSSILVKCAQSTENYILEFPQ